MAGRTRQCRPTSAGTSPGDWVNAWIGLAAERLMSYAAAGGLAGHNRRGSAAAGGRARRDRAARAAPPRAMMFHGPVSQWPVTGREPGRGPQHQSHQVTHHASCASPAAEQHTIIYLRLPGSGRSVRLLGAPGCMLMRASWIAAYLERETSHWICNYTGGTCAGHRGLRLRSESVPPRLSVVAH
jgi:hypothetical protein